MALGSLWRPEHSKTHSEHNAQPHTWTCSQGSPSRGATLFAVVWETAGFEGATKAPDRHTALQMTGGLCDALEWAYPCEAGTAALPAAIVRMRQDLVASAYPER